MREELTLTLDREILLSVPQASALMHTDANRVRRMISKGYIRALKLGEIKIRRTEVDRFLEWAEGKDLSDINDIKELAI